MSARKSRTKVVPRILDASLGLSKSEWRYKNAID